MSDRPLVRLAENIKLLKKLDETGIAIIHIDEWLRFFEVMAYLTRDGVHREIHCAIVGDYLVFSKTPIERKAKREPTQSELFER